MTKKFEIEVPELPDGWIAISYRKPINENENTLSDEDGIVKTKGINFPCLIVKKIKPRKIVLEENSCTEYHKREDILMTKLHVLPDGNAIELSRVVAVHYVKSFRGEYHSAPEKVKIEYAGYSNNLFENITASFVEFDIAEAAIKFRDEFIALVNSQYGEKND